MVLDLSNDFSVSVEQAIQPNFVLVLDVEQNAEPPAGQEQPLVEEPVYNPEDWAMVVYNPPPAADHVVVEPIAI